MIEKSLISERCLTYVTNYAGGTTGDTYNGVAASGTSTAKMVPGVAGSGKGIDVTGFNRALVVVSTGNISTTAAIKAWVSLLGVIATDASMTQLLPFEIDLTGSSDNGVFVGELDLRGAPGNSLWIEHNGTDATTVIAVILFDAAVMPTSQVLVTGALYQA